MGEATEGENLQFGGWADGRTRHALRWHLTMLGAGLSFCSWITARYSVSSGKLEHLAQR